MADTIPQQVQTNDKLWVTFNLDQEGYCINSRYILALDIPTEIKDMPNNPQHMMGIMRWNNRSLPIVSMRALLGMPTMEESVNQFAIMRQMHLEWIEALEDSVKNHKPFLKAIDPHKCKFGMWYDSFDTANISMRFILTKIGPPHDSLHYHGAQAQDLMARNDWEGAEAKYREAQVICTNEVLPLLDELIETYKEVNRGIVIVVEYEDQILGLMVDEIDQLIPTAKAEIHPVPAAVSNSPYIDRIILTQDKTYSSLDMPAIADFVKAEQEQAREIAAATGIARS